MARAIIVPHGSRTMYVAHHCRCEDCTLAQREYQRNYRARMYASGYVFRKGFLRRPSKNPIGRPSKAIQTTQTTGAQT